MHGLTSGQQANVSEEGVVDLEGIEGIQAGVIDGGHQDVLLALAAAASGTLIICFADLQGVLRQTSVLHLNKFSLPVRCTCLRILDWCIAYQHYGHDSTCLQPHSRIRIQEL